MQPSLFRTKMDAHLFLFLLALSQSPYRQWSLFHWLPHCSSQASTSLYPARFSTCILLCLLPALVCTFHGLFFDVKIEVICSSETLLSSELHSVTTQKTIHFINAMRTSNPIKITDSGSVKLIVRWQNTLNRGTLNEGSTALAVSGHETVFEYDTAKSEH
jgi:hypothetical protein